MKSMYRVNRIGNGLIFVSCCLRLPPDYQPSTFIPSPLHLYVEASGVEYESRGQGEGREELNKRRRNEDVHVQQHGISLSH